jgi:hypothetical protein
MGRFLGRALLSVLGGFAGSAAGFALYQLRTRQSEIDRGAADITVAAPPITAGAAALFGVVSGRRGPVFALLAGTALAAAFGTSLDERVTGLAAGQVKRASSTSSSQSSG